MGKWNNLLQFMMKALGHNEAIEMHAFIFNYWFPLKVLFYLL